LILINQVTTAFLSQEVRNEVPQKSQDQ